MHRQGPDTQVLLSSIDDALVRSPVPEDFFPDFDRIASGLIQYDRMAIAFYVNRRFQSEYAYVSGTPIAGFEQRSFHTISRDVARTWFVRKKTVHQDDRHRQGDRVFDEFNAKAREAGLHSLLIAPIWWRGESIGDLVLRSRGRETYSDSDHALIETLANKVSGVVANVQAASQTRHESNLRESLLELSRLVSSVHSLHEVQEKFGEIACSLVGADRVSVTVPDASGRAFDNVLVYGRDTEIVGYGPGAHNFMEESETIPWLGTTDSHIVDDDLRNRSRTTAAIERLAAGAGLKSTLIAPVVWRGKSIAAIAFRSRTERAFNRYNLETASAIARQVAGAIASQMAHEEVRRESRTRELLAKISRVASSSTNLDSNFTELGEMITDLIPSDRMSISVMPEPGVVPELLHDYGVPLEGLTPGSVPPVKGQLLTRLMRDPIPTVIEGTDPGMSSDFAIMARYSEPAGLKSWMVAPLMWREELLGIIHFRSRRERAYGRHELELAGQVAHQIAGSVASNIAYVQLKTEAKTRGVLARISRAISSSLSLDDSFESFAKLVSELIPVDRLAVSLFASTGDPAVYVKSYGFPFEDAGAHGAPRVRQALASMLAADPVPVILDDLEPDALAGLSDMISVAEQWNLRSWMAAPLVWGNEMTGILHFRSSKPNSFDESHRELAQQVADQIANFMANTVAYQQLEKEVRVRHLLTQVSLIVSTSDNFAKTLPKLQKLIKTVLDFDGFSIGAFDSETHLFRDIHTEGLSDAEAETGVPFPVADSVAADAIAAGITRSVSPGSIEEVGDRQRSVRSFRAGTRTFLTATLISNDAAIGALQLRSTRLDAYDDADIEIVRRIADQIAGAFANSLAIERIRVQAAALESADNAIVITTPDGTIEWVNPAFTALTGWTAAEATGLHTSIMRSIDPADRPVNDEIWAALRQGKSWSGTHRNRKKDGTEYPEEITVTPVLDPDGEIVHIVGIKQEITERVLAEQRHENTIRIESENRELQRIAAARSEFLSTVSHELRTPLTSVSAFTDILFNSNSENLTDRQRTHLGLIRKSSRQLASLIDDLLDVSQADSGRLIKKTERFGLREMVDEVADLTRVLLAERQQSLKLTNPDSPLDLLADRLRVIQILTNLLTNASKFSDRGSTVGLHVEVDDGHVTFTVSDRGPGISKPDQSMMFSPFYRGSGPETAETVGSGLGLSVVQSLVDLHDGTITVDSRKGKGTSIMVRLPGVWPTHG